jgi:hypothetical protein
LLAKWSDDSREFRLERTELLVTKRRRRPAFVLEMAAFLFASAFTALGSVAISQPGDSAWPCGLR